MYKRIVGSFGAHSKAFVKTIRFTKTLFWYVLILYILNEIDFLQTLRERLLQVFVYPLGKLY